MVTDTIVYVYNDSITFSDVQNWKRPLIVYSNHRASHQSVRIGSGPRDVPVICDCCSQRGDTLTEQSEIQRPRKHVACRKQQMFQRGGCIGKFRSFRACILYTRLGWTRFGSRRSEPVNHRDNGGDVQVAQSEKISVGILSRKSWTRSDR